MRDIDWQYILLKAKEEGTDKELKKFKEKAEEKLGEM